MIKKIKLSEVVDDLTEERKLIIGNDEDILEPTINSREHKISVRRVIRGSELKIKNRILIKKGDLVFSKLHTQNGSFAISDSEYKSTTTFLPLKIKEDLILKDYLFWILHLLVPNLRASDTVGRETYKTEDILNIEFILPTVIEQKRIMKQILDSKQKMDKLYLNIEQQSKFLENLRQAILQEAVSGKLVPQDPKDEPASELLKKIKAEKEKLIREGKIRKDKPLPPIIEEEIPYELPNGWVWARLGDLIELISGQHIMSSNYNLESNGTPYITGPADFGEIHPIISKWTTSPKVISIKGDILITVKGAGLGKLNITGIKEVVISRQLMAIRQYFILKEYLYSFLNLKFLHFQNRGVGIAIPGLSREDITFLVFPLPPLPEQKRIVEKVGQLMKLCDELETKVKENQKNSELLMEAVLREAFEV